MKLSAEDLVQKDTSTILLEEAEEDGPAPVDLLTIPKLQKTLKMCDKSRTFMPTIGQGLWRKETYNAVAPYNLMLATKMEKAQQPMPVESFSQACAVSRPSELLHMTYTISQDLQVQHALLPPILALKLTD